MGQDGWGGSGLAAGVDSGKAVSPHAHHVMDPTQRPRLAVVVDDDPAVASVLAAFVRRLGFEVSVATSESQAAELLHERPADLLVTDLQLGGGGSEGLSLVRLARELSTDVRTLLVSGSVGPEMASAVRLSADRFLAKPVAFNDLAATVESLFAADPAGAGQGT